MQNSQIDLTHDMTPKNTTSPIVGGKPKYKEELLWGDAIQKLKSRIPKQHQNITKQKQNNYFKK